MHLGDIDSDRDFTGARDSWVFNLPTYRSFHGFRVIKLLLLTAVVGVIFGGGLQYVSNANARMLRYERQLQSLHLALRDSDKKLADRMKRGIYDSIEAQLVHSISKRDSNDSELPEYPEPRNDNEYVGGVTYIRWGRRDCPNGELTRFVYTGYMAGSHSTHTGGGSNYVCLHRDVSYTPSKYLDGNQGSSYLYGTEFRDANNWMNTLFDLSETEANGMQFHSVPCAMCMAEARVSQMMVPGRETCPVGWHEEYVGYIMAGSHSDKHGSEYICVDERPHIVPGTIGDQNGAYLQVVETQCASLLCEPFVAGRELRCVVCTI